MRQPHSGGKKIPAVNSFLADHIMELQASDGTYRRRARVSWRRCVGGGRRLACLHCGTRKGWGLGGGVVVISPGDASRAPVSGVKEQVSSSRLGDSSG